MTNIEEVCLQVQTDERRGEGQDQEAEIEIEKGGGKDQDQEIGGGVVHDHVIGKRGRGRKIVEAETLTLEVKVRNQTMRTIP